MPTVTRERTVRAAPEEVWRLVSDPEHLPRWWPGVRRVEDVQGGGWTTVLTSPKGKTVRADYSLVEHQSERRVVWRQEVEESPFERILRSSHTELDVSPGDGGTRVSLTIRHRPRGFARLGTVQMRMATVRLVEGALEGLADLLEEPEA